MYSTSPSLLERLRQPDEPEAWARFVDLYTPLLLFWTRRLGVGRADADDLIQEVFALLVQKLPEFTYDSKKSFRGWLRTVVINKWRDLQRKNHPCIAADDSPLDEKVAPDGLSAIWEDEYQRYLVGRALAVMREQFEPVTWQACWEFIVGGEPAAAVAARLGLTENAVYIAKTRVLRRLRQELEGLMD